jgi:hypothetical protein
MVSKQFFHLWNCGRNLRKRAPIGRKFRQNSRPLKQNSVPTATLSEKLTPDAVTILSQLRARCKKSKIDLTDLEIILEIIESGSKKIITDMT